MTLFHVVIMSGEGKHRRTVEYDIRDRSHNDTAPLAAEEALRTFRSHGHAHFPHNDGPLTMSVNKVEEAKF